MKKQEKQKEEIIPQYFRDGKARVVLTNEKGVSKEFDVARMVAETFVPNPNNHPYIYHINGDKMDNRAENLQWVASHENHSAK